MKKVRIAFISLFICNRCSFKRKQILLFYSSRYI